MIIKYKGVDFFGKNISALVSKQIQSTFKSYWAIGNYNCMVLQALSF